MKKIFSYLALSVFLVLTACPAKEESFTAKFEGETSEQKWAIKYLNPDLPADWDPYEYLSFDLKASSSQRIDLRLYDKEGVRRIRVHPFEGVETRVSIPLSRFKSISIHGTSMSSTYQAGLPTSWLNFHHGPFGSLNSVDSLGVSIVSPIDSPTLEISNLRLTMTPEDTIYRPVPLIDEFGQWIPADWPGKANTLDGLKAAWEKEESELETGRFNVSKYGGYLNTRVRSTGFFRVEKIDGRWWFVDPDGYLFFSAGTTGIRTRSDFARIDGREYLFKALPPEEVIASDQSGISTNSIPFYVWNLYRRHGQNWYEGWMELTARRLEDWGFNTIANWSDTNLGRSQGKPYVMNISGWGIDARTMGMPDVYAPGYIELVDDAARSQCAPLKDDPYLIGYFIGNEPIWPGREMELVNVILEGDETPMQYALKKFLAEGDTPGRRREFVYNTYSKFIGIVDSAIKKYDPNHLNLGLRFGGSAPTGIVEHSKKYFDVFSINFYGFTPNMNEIQKIYDISGLPVVVGEFHFGTPGRGLAPGLVQTKNQEERGVAYRYYVETAAAHPAVIGSHWFQWIDQPSTGRNDGENYNIGLVDMTDRPYRELIDAARETHKRLFGIHSGNVPPVERRALTH